MKDSSDLHRRALAMSLCSLVAMIGDPSWMKSKGEGCCTTPAFTPTNRILERGEGKLQV